MQGTGKTENTLGEKSLYEKNSNSKSSCNECERDSLALVNSIPILNRNIPSQSKYVSLPVEERQRNDETDAERAYAEILKYCQMTKIHFVDDSFPPILRSVGNEGLNVKVLQWLRIRDIAPSLLDDSQFKWSVMLKDPNSSDIQQGQLGDCWLMAALALITERPAMLQHILLTKEVNNEGIYLIRLCKNGQWVTVMVDDCFPCTSGKILAFTQAKRRQLYVPLIEKACAKIFGSYSNLIGGQTSEGLLLLTGAPCNHIHLENHYTTNHNGGEQIDSDVLWAKLLSACEFDLLIGASTGRSDISNDEYTHIKIHGNHAFSILKVYSLSHDERFVLVRDPHSCTRYEDKYITRETLNLLQAFHRGERRSGSFWMSWRIFLKYFSTITICQWRSDLFDVRSDGQFTTDASQPINAYYFYIKTTTQINISLVYHKQDRKQRTCHIQTFLLCDINSTTGKIGAITAIIRSRRGGFTYWNGSLRDGSYMLIPFSTSFWSNKHHISSLKYTVVIHSSNLLDLTHIEEPVTLLADCLIAAVIKNCRKPNMVR
ncbi:unnamed protein product [Didymodactylos carnosus]|uniref:Calpain catalytic domain-containing protein n=1 Tax=Didymodactylos carnosus TaxID=1234261 RepID=A0A8S2EER8_9BILA|nr:unnamed protein product [Didymodactylos carnosus]CAF3996676.1 unnamed protein product [Didymodactylos carnosus]